MRDGTIVNQVGGVAMATKSFRNFIRSATVTDNPRGDFIGDAKADHELPDVKTWEELEDYLWRSRAPKRRRVFS
jgi:hypothetical protein